MPRNASGVMVLPVGNPVIPGTLIDSSWANPTMADLANEITRSLPRDGAAGMTGPLMLARDGILPKEAVTVDQVNAALTGSNSYLPAGAVQYFAMMAIPAGWLEANGAAVSRTTYANLFATIGTTYGAGNGTTTFNLPDLRGTFIRGFDNGRSLDPGRAFGSSQEGSNSPHTHAVSDPGHAHSASQPAHAHGITDPGHAHAQDAHAHGVNDPGHSHTVALNSIGQAYDSGGGPVPTREGGSTPTSATATGISLVAAQPNIKAAVTGVSTVSAQPGVTVSTAATGLALAQNGLEARPVNTALVACIKAFGALQTDGLGTMAFQNKEAVQIAGGTGVFSSLQCSKTPTEPNDVARLSDVGGSISSVLSSDPQVLLVDITTPNSPVLRPQTNVPFGAAKLNAVGQIPASLLPMSDLNYQGPWDASTGNTPSQTYPAVTFEDGDQYQIAVAGTLTVYGPAGTATPTVCAMGGSVVYVVGSPTFSSPGWYYNPPISFSGASASQIANVPAGNIAATNVQAAINELDTDKAPKASPIFTGPVTSPQYYNVTQPYGALQVAGVDVMRFGSDTSGQLAGFRNILINGKLNINQRGVTIAAAVIGAYGPDRWKKVDASNMTQIVEAGNYVPNAVYTLSGDGVTTGQVTAPASGHWTIPNIPIGATKIQLELGSIATPFELRPYGVELALCQRYYEKQLFTNAADIAIGQALSASSARCAVPCALKRTAPSVLLSGTIAVFTSTGTDAGGTKSGLISNPHAGVIQVTGATGLVAGNAVIFYANASAYIEFQSEL